MKNKDDECVRWCPIRHLNPNNIVAQRIENSEEKVLQALIIKVLSFLLLKKVIIRLRQKNNISIMCLGMEINKYIQFIDQAKVLEIIWNYCC